MENKDLGFIRVGAIVPKIKVANPDWNSEEIIKQLKDAEENYNQNILN